MGNKSGVSGVWNVLIVHLRLDNTRRLTVTGNRSNVCDSAVHGVFQMVIK